MIKNLPASARDARDLGSIPGSGRLPGIGNDNPLQYSCLDNPMDGGALWATVHGVAEYQIHLSMHSHNISNSLHTPALDSRHCEVLRR